MTADQAQSGQVDFIEGFAELMRDVFHKFPYSLEKAKDAKSITKVVG